MFGVSTRTILCDIDAIDLAGIPIVTYQGVNGGIEIAEGYRLDKSILTSDDYGINHNYAERLNQCYAG